MVGVYRLIVVVSLLIAIGPAVALAQAPVKAGVVTNLQGNVTAARTTQTQPLPLKFKDDVMLNDRVVAGDRSLARLLLGGKAVVTVRERSALTITEVPGRTTIDLDSGKIAVSVVKDRMQPGDQIEVKTPNAVAAVRGTVFVVEVIRSTADASGAQSGTTTNIFTFTGQVLFSVGAQTLNIGPNTFANATGTLVNSGPITPAMHNSAWGGLTISGVQEVNGGQDGARDMAMGTTVATFSTGLPSLTPPSIPSPPGPNTNVQNLLLPGGTQSLPSLPSLPQLPLKNPNGPPIPGGSGNLNGPPVRGQANGPVSRVTPDSNAIHLVDLAFSVQRAGTWNAFMIGDMNDVPGGQDAARDMAVGATIATFSAGLPEFSPARTPPAPGPDRQIHHLLLPGGITALQLPLAELPLAEPRARNPGGTVTPDSIMRPPPELTQPFGPISPGGLVTDQYSSLGLMFGPKPVAIFNDPPVAWAGGNSGSVLDLVSPVQVSFVIPGTSRAATTGHLSLEVGLAPVGTVLLQAFSASGALLGTTINDDGLGPHGRTLATLDVSGVRSFLVTGNDTWGIDQITFGDLTEPGHQAPGIAGSVIGQFAAFSNFDHTSEGSFLRLADGVRFGTSGPEALVSWSGGTLTVGTGSDGGHLFDLVGRAGATQVDDSGLTVGTDQPLQPGPGAPVFRASNGAVVIVNGSAYRVDTVLLEATGPLLNLVGNSSMTTASHAIDLVGRSKVAIPNDAIAMVRLNDASLTVRSGHLVNVDSSVLSVAGHFLGMSGGSILNILNGLLLNASNNSVVNIGGKFINFSGTGNVINITNSIVPTAIINGIPVAGAVDALRLSPGAIAGLGTSGTIKINGVTLTATTPLSSLTGSLVAVQTGSVVKIGQ